MNCENARTQLFELDPNSLAALIRDNEEHAELREHVRGCARCAEDLRAIVEDHAALVSAVANLEHAAPAPHAHRHATQATRRISWRVAVPLTLAAAFASILLFKPAPRTRSTLNETPPQPAASLVVNVPRGHDVTIFKTSNPKITIVWYH